MRSKTDSHENPIIEAPKTLPPHLRDDSPRSEVRCWTDIEAENVRLREALQFVVDETAPSKRLDFVGTGNQTALRRIHERALKALETK